MSKKTPSVYAIYNKYFSPSPMMFWIVMSTDFFQSRHNSSPKRYFGVAFGIYIDVQQPVKTIWKNRGQANGPKILGTYIVGPAALVQVWGIYPSHMQAGHRL